MRMSLWFAHEEAGKSPLRQAIFECSSITFHTAASAVHHQPTNWNSFPSYPTSVCQRSCTKTGCRKTNLEKRKFTTICYPISNAVCTCIHFITASEMVRCKMFAQYSQDCERIGNLALTQPARPVILFSKVMLGHAYHHGVLQSPKLSRHP